MSFIDINRCNHEFANDPELGEKYSNLTACRKCGKQGRTTDVSVNFF